MKAVILLVLGYVLLSCSEETGKKRVVEKNVLSTKDSLSLELEELFAEGLIPGMAVLVVNENGIVYQKEMGMANLTRETPFTIETVQPIGSISKSLIGVSLLKAQEMGLLSLDDPINRYLPFEVSNPFFPGDSITIRQLASHTSSIIDSDIFKDSTLVLRSKSDTIHLDSSIYHAFRLPTHVSLSDFLSETISPQGKWYTKDAFLKVPPGSQHIHSNTGASLAALIIECVSKKKFSTFTRENVLAPLHMYGSGWSYHAVNFSKVSTPYANPITRYPYYSVLTYPEGGLLSSGKDLSRYLQELIKGNQGNGTLLSKESYAELFEPQLDSIYFTINTFSPMNSGIFQELYPNGDIGSRGALPGFSASMIFNPETRTGSIILVNTDIIHMEPVEEEYQAIVTRLNEYVGRL